MASSKSFASDPSIVTKGTLVKSFLLSDKFKFNLSNSLETPSFHKLDRLFSSITCVIACSILFI